MVHYTISMCAFKKFSIKINFNSYFLLYPIFESCEILLVLQIHTSCQLTDLRLLHYLVVGFCFILLSAFKMSLANHSGESIISAFIFRFLQCVFLPSIIFLYFRCIFSCFPSGRVPQLDLPTHEFVLQLYLDSHVYYILLTHTFILTSKNFCYF